MVINAPHNLAAQFLRRIYNCIFIHVCHKRKKMLHKFDHTFDKGDSVGTQSIHLALFYKTLADKGIYSLFSDRCLSVDSSLSVAFIYRRF